FGTEQQTVAEYAVNFCSSPMRRRGLPSQQSVLVTERTFAAAYLTGRNGWCPAAQETKKLPFGKISSPMSDKESIADAVAPNPQRQLWPTTGPPGDSLGCLFYSGEPTPKA
ncbi:MAG: hypothetical protein WBM67_06780, partial [Sedimenticolaceae bacterium]